MKEITENKELDFIFKLGVGFVFNDFTTSPKNGNKWNKLHKATCSCMDSENPNRLKVEGKNRKLPKIFFETYDKAHEWLKTNRNKVGYSDCDICFKIK
ncbi:MAG: hypothetical protein O8C61_04675 [Candidatus Methanoperedens sp.]|nr:hypothetical protein [Candidatus Methanoperedens sp.]